MDNSEKTRKYEQSAKLGKFGEIATISAYNGDEVYLRWEGGDKPCNQCRKYIGEVRLAKGWDVQPPLHPNCECELVVEKNEMKTAQSVSENEKRFGKNAPVPQEYRERLSKAIDNALFLLRQGNGTPYEFYRNSAIEGLEKLQLHSQYGARDSKGKHLKLENALDGWQGRAGSILNNPDVWLDTYALDRMSDKELMVTLVHEALHTVGVPDRFLPDPITGKHEEWPSVTHSNREMGRIARMLLGLEGL